ncbi:MAG: HAMP domain-containing histidine kinase [Clostridiales bacterium]|nr:HAMP domain-containing histidine kinase [Clostridiales bacterium]
MKNEMTKKTEGIGNKIRFSIVFKLNMRLFMRMAGLFIAFDILLFMAAMVTMVVYAEKTAGQAVKVFQDYGLPEENTQQWLSVVNINITVIGQEPQGFVLPDFLQKAVHGQTAAGAREFSIPETENASFFHQLDRLTYNIEFKQYHLTYRVSVGFSEIMPVLKYIFLILLFIQFTMLIKSIFSGARLIRMTLKPIAELAEKAQSFNSDGGASSLEKMQALAGKLDGINAAKLDTRISIEGTQDELKNLAGAINGMLDRINESYRAQVRFVSDASHELRTPISVIQGYANLLDRWGKNDEKTLQESIDAIKDEAANMKALVEQLLFLARGDNNTMTLQMEQFDLSTLASEVLKETQMIDGGHVYQSQINEVAVFADQALIKQALRILMDNAIKYTNAGGHITVSVSKENNLAKLTVQDDGIGIPPEDVPKIFERFYRADESRARATGGTGLGLSIAKWIAERHGGHMEVLSRNDIGTRISILLPFSDGQQMPGV